jgi:hypothetical protein
MFKNISKVAALAAVVLSGAPVMAQEANLNTSSSNSAQNVQSNSGAVNLAPMGGSNANYQINSVSNSQFGFAPGIQCPTPELAVGAFGGQTNGWGNTGYNTSGNNVGGTVMFTMPLGGDTAEYCKQLAREIAKQRRLDTEVNMIRQCAQLANSGITVDVEQFPDFALCAGVRGANGNTALLEEPERVFSPAETAVPVIPVSKTLSTLQQQLNAVTAN